MNELPVSHESGRMESAYGNFMVFFDILDQIGEKTEKIIAEQMIIFS